MSVSSEKPLIGPESDSESQEDLQEQAATTSVAAQPTPSRTSRKRCEDPPQWLEEFPQKLERSAEQRREEDRRIQQEWRKKQEEEMVKQEEWRQKQEAEMKERAKILCEMKDIFKTWFDKQ